MSKPSEYFLLLKVILFAIGNTYLCKRPLNEIYCPSASSLHLNENVIGIHAFFSLFERVIGFYPFPTFS